MNTERSKRRQVLDHIELLASPSKQLLYEKDVPIAHVHSELILGYVYQPKDNEFIDAFTCSELKDLAHLYGLLCEASGITVSSVTELLKQEKWRCVVSLAKEISARVK